MLQLLCGLFFIFHLCIFPLFSTQVHIFTYAYNRPDFIEIQYKTFQKFLKDDWEFIVFNDAVNESLKSQIQQKCRELNISCIDIPQEIHRLPYLYRWPGEDFNHPSVRNCNVVQYSLDTLGFQQKGVVALFDSDLFLVRDFSIIDYLNNHHIAGFAQRKESRGAIANYLWIGLVFIDMENAPQANTLNFNCGLIDRVPVDAGGHTHYYLKNHPEAKIKYMNQCMWPFHQCDTCFKNKVMPCHHNHDQLLAAGFDENQISFIHAGPINCEFYIDNHFLHYRRGTNWDYKSDEFHHKKTAILNDYIQNIFNN